MTRARKAAIAAMVHAREAAPTCQAWRAGVRTWLRSLSPEQREAIREWQALMRDASDKWERRDAWAALDEVLP